MRTWSRRRVSWIALAACVSFAVGCGGEGDEGAEGGEGGGSTVVDSGGGDGGGGTASGSGGDLVETDSPGNFDAPAPTSCTSGQKWTGGNEGSGNMNPGADCVGCHANAGSEAPQFAIAGTVFSDAHEPDGCYGVSGAFVELTDSNGKVFTLKTNAAGNFYARAKDLPDFTPPYTARVIVGGVFRKMNSPQTAPSCNGCHTADGANGAPGRILTP